MTGRLVSRDSADGAEDSVNVLTESPLFGCVQTASPSHYSIYSPLMGELRETERQMRLRYAGTCSLCGTELKRGQLALFDSASKAVRCVECATTVADAAPRDDDIEPPASTAGASARAEYERRKTKREDRIRSSHPKLGGLILALTDEPQSQKAWATGSTGEETLGRHLDSLASDDVAVLHDRLIPGSRANIDHLVVTRFGVWIVDAKKYKGRPELKVEGGIVRPRVEKVLVAGRDRTKLIDGALKQVAVVSDIVGPEIQVRGALCFVGADWPLVGGSFVTRDVHVLWFKKLASLIVSESGGGLDVSAIRATLAARLRAAEG